MFKFNMFKSIVLSAIRFYQIIFSPDQGFLRRPFYGCRFFPSCSEYTFQAIRKYGFFKGAFWGIKRILRCHPYSQGGYDPLIIQSAKRKNQNDKSRFKIS